jgi:hypothetical protein
MLRLILTLAAWGIVGMLLIGPVLALVGVTLGLIAMVIGILAPFVILGLLFYVPYRLLFRRDLRWQHARAASGTAWQSPVVPPARWCARTVHGATAWPGLIYNRAVAVAGIVLEALCGALIGTGLGWLLASSLSRRETVLYALLGGLAGAVLGLFVGLANHVTALRGRTSSS